MKMTSAISIGIIGGADGPTAVFVTGNPIPALIVSGGVLAAAAVWLFIRKRKK